eukprot:UN02527
MLKSTKENGTRCTELKELEDNQESVVRFSTMMELKSMERENLQSKNVELRGEGSDQKGK